MLAVLTFLASSVSFPLAADFSFACPNLKVFSVALRLGEQRFYYSVCKATHRDFVRFNDLRPVGF